jgi:ubiquitin carboxyl-terminal hydrolase 4/11/15
LNYIIDGINEDLNRIKKKPFVEVLVFNDENNERDAKFAWENYLKLSQSFVQDKLVKFFLYKIFLFSSYILKIRNKV